MKIRLISKPLMAVLVTMAVGLGSISSAQAANWFKLRGTEPGGTSSTLQVWGFLQPTFMTDTSDRITGAVMAAAGAIPPMGTFSPISGGNGINGDLPVQGTILPDRVSQDSFLMRRARIGIRGTMLPIDNNVDYFILTEFGENGLTRGAGGQQDGGAVLLDASVTLNHLSRGLDANGLHNLGVRFRFGQFLFSQVSQSLSQSTPGRRVHIWMPEATRAFALTRRVSDNGPFNNNGQVNGARDIGLEAFDFVEFGNPKAPWEFTYSYAIGNGGTIGEINRDNNFRHYAWLSLAKLFDKTRGPRRHDAQVYWFYQQGDILFNNDVNGDGVADSQGSVMGGVGINPVSGLQNLAGCGGTIAACRLNTQGRARDEGQKYWGAGVEYFDKPFKNFGQIRFEAEYQKQTGLIFDGVQSPSADIQKFNGFGLRYDVDGESDGWYVDAGYDIHQHLGLKGRTTINVRYDTFSRNKGNNLREVEFNQLSVTGEYFFHKKGRLTFTYQFRDYNADDRLAGSPQRTNGNAVLNAIDDRVGVQFTLIYKNVLIR